MLMTLGRVLFALLFIFSGASKFFDIGSTAQIIETKVGIPEIAAGYTGQIEAAVGMTVFRLLAVIAASVEVICGLMIAFNLASRFFAVILVIFVAVATFYVHDFWNQTGGSRAAREHRPCDEERLHHRRAVHDHRLSAVADLDGRADLPRSGGDVGCRGRLVSWFRNSLHP